MWSALIFLAVVVTPGETAPEAGGEGAGMIEVRMVPLTDEEKTALQSASLLFSAGDFRGCLEALGVEGAAASGHPDLLTLRGAALSELGRHSEAVPFLRWAVKGNPNHFWAAYNLAECVYLLGDRTGARELFLAVPAASASEKELVALKLVLLAVLSDDLAAARGHLPVWPPASAYGIAAYAVMAHAENDETKRDELFLQLRELHPAAWDSFLKKTLLEAGVPLE